MTHSEDYKRGLLDMLETLTVTESNSGAIKIRWRDSTDFRSINAKPPLLQIALNYREELENRKTVLTAIELLTKKGYTIFDPGDAPKPPMLSQEQMIKLLQNDGYSIMYPSQPAMWTNKNGDRVPFKGTGHEEDENTRSTIGPAFYND